MLRALEQLSMPSRADLISLAERFTNLEMRLDDMDAKLDELLALSKVPPPAPPQQDIELRLAELDSKLERMLELLAKAKPSGQLMEKESK
jgi:hypothetical protein